jgi:hypothetical protein
MSYEEEVGIMLGSLEHKNSLWFDLAELGAKADKEIAELTNQCYEYNKEVGELKTALKNAREFITFSEFSSWRDNVLAEIEKVLGE